jgi:hypothetical protein
VTQVESKGRRMQARYHTVEYTTLAQRACQARSRGKWARRGDRHWRKLARVEVLAPCRKPSSD